MGPRGTYCITGITNWEEPCAEIFCPFNIVASRLDALHYECIILMEIEEHECTVTCEVWYNKQQFYRGSVLSFLGIPEQFMRIRIR
jgi:hypothetical protein